MRIRRSILSAMSLLVAGCQSAPQGAIDQAECARDLSWYESLDRGLARFVSMGCNTVEGLGRDLSHDGLLVGVLPGTANLLTEGVIGDLLVDGVGGGLLYLSTSDGIARAARDRSSNLARSTHVSLVKGRSGRANIVELDQGNGIAESNYTAQPYAVMLDQSFGALAGMPFGIVRQVGDTFERNGFLLGLVELVPATIVSVVSEVGGGLGKFGTLIVGQGAAADSIDRWQRELNGTVRVFGN